MPLFQNTNLTQGLWLGGSNLMNQSVWLWDYTRIPISQWDNNPSIQWDLSVGSQHCLEVFKGDNANYKLNGVECDDEKSFMCSAKLVESLLKVASVLSSPNVKDNLLGFTISIET
ncbi:CD209 antigen-like protein 2 [Biomphalaria pfeifferi]|uniref:CD209 antigen-like protein 2 n=1 Tax=Biomphalaria pfeifferi TaxID=112525 RepID=A0AAD8BX32_BIOPF|nr:CD209 antigen-like protein 2 [Biomphalaria pfeifferi]